jgi:hypothetical protein
MFYFDGSILRIVLIKNLITFTNNLISVDCSNDKSIHVKGDNLSLVLLDYETKEMQLSGKIKSVEVGVCNG